MRALALAIALSAQPLTPDEAPILMLKAWIDAVDHHVAGEVDASVDALNAWTYNDLEAMRPYVEFLVLAPTESDRARAARRQRLTRAERAAIDELRRTGLPSRDDINTFRKRAAILHTDTAIVGAMPRVVDAPRTFPGRVISPAPSRRVDVMSADGRPERFEVSNPHWDYARDMLDSLPRQPRAPIVAQWARTIGAYYASERNYADAIYHFGWARSAAPDDPLVLYGAACLQETLGSPRIQDYVRVTTLPNGLKIMGVESAQSHLRRAEDLLRRSLAASPRFAEANLRLGRVLAQLGRPDEALPYLRTAIAESRDRALSYYAHLFSGDAEASAGRELDARRSYEQALALFPDAQAAPMGLAAVMSSGGNREAALAAMIPTLTKEPVSRVGDDPWWDYYLGDAANLEGLLDELRAPFRSARQ